MVFHLVSLGLGDEKDITVRGLEIVKGCERLYLDMYTAILGVDVDRLSEYYGKTVIVADRKMVEQRAEEILRDADKVDVAFLVVGDVFAATTHHDIMLRAHEKNIPVNVVHNASIMNAVACCGLQLYNFGQTVSIPYFDGEWRPYSFYEKILANYKIGLHTLCLLDIKVKEQTKENLAKEIEVYQPPRFMSVNEAIEHLFECEEHYKAGICTPDVWAIGMARVGQPTQQIVSGTLQELSTVDFGGPLHSLVLVGPVVHPLEVDMFYHYFWDQENKEAKREEHILAQEAKRMAELEARLKEQKLKAEQRKAEIAAKKAALAAKPSSDSDSDDEEESDE